MNGLISVICTVKNGESTIAETIESVLRQTYKKIEFIIVDDGSTDKTRSIVESYQKKDSRIFLMKNEKPGRSRALNKAVKYSQGKYIVNIDADDLMHPDKINEQIRLFEKNKNYFLLATDILIIKEEEIAKWDTVRDKLTIKNINQRIIIENNISHSTVMMRKNVLKRLGGYREDLETQVDYDLWLRAFREEYQMGIIEYPLGAKRIHSKQSFENKKRLRYTWNSMKIQYYAIFQDLCYLYYLPLPIIRFLAAQLPFSIRRKLSETLKG